MFLHVHIFNSQADFINWALDIGRRSGFIIVTKTSTSGGLNNKNPGLHLDVRGVGVIERT